MQMNIRCRGQFNSLNDTLPSYVCSYSLAKTEN